MSEADVLIEASGCGEYTASFEKVKSKDVDGDKGEEMEDSNSSTQSDQEAEAFMLGLDNNAEEAVLTSTPLTHRSGVCFDSLAGEDKTPLVQADPLMSDPSEGINGDIDPESEESSQNKDDTSEEGDRHRDLNIMRHVMSLDHSRESLMVPGMLKVPIVGYETMEARSKFTIYKIHVMMGEEDAGWFVFRRYSDFVHLNEQLRELFPNMRLALPPKRWFRSNFDPDFLQDRKVGLQEFLENVTGHRDILSSQPVRDFFCFDDPPSVHDSLEESRAQCECLEEITHLLRKELGEKEIEMDLLKEEIDLYKNQVRLLTERLSEMNKSICLQEKSSFENRNTSSVSTPSLRMRSVNMKTSVSNMEISEADKKNSSSTSRQKTIETNNFKSDSNIPHSASIKFSSNLITEKQCTDSTVKSSFHIEQSCNSPAKDRMTPSEDSVGLDNSSDDNLSSGEVESIKNVGKSLNDPGQDKSTPEM